MEPREDVKQIVPWFSSLEWIDTAKKIYGENPEDRTKAFNVLRLWRARSEALPTGVDTTLVLLCALESSIADDDLDDLPRRLALSAALTRFLNHALVTGQKDPFSQSMFKRAKGVDLPSWMIKLRHEAAHGKSIPALEPLVDAAHQAVEWLRDNYWHQPPQDYKPPEPPLDLLMDEWEALSACLQAGYRKVASLPDKRLKSTHHRSKTVPEAIQKMEMKILSVAANDPEVLLSAIFSCCQTFLTPPEGLYGREELPAALVNQWLSMLAVLHSGRLLPTLIDRLHEKDSRLASLWVLYLLGVVEQMRKAQRALRAAGVVLKEVPSTAKFVQRRKEAVADLPLEAKIKEDAGVEAAWPLFVAAPSAEELRQVALDVASKPNKNGRVFIQKLLDLSEIELFKKENILKVWSIYFGDVHSDPEGEVRSLEDLLQTSLVQEDCDKWIKCGDWHPKSIGTLPWQDGYVDLTMDYQWE